MPNSWTRIALTLIAAFSLGLSGCLGGTDSGGPRSNNGTSSDDADAGPLSAAALEDATLLAADSEAVLEEIETDQDLEDIQDELTTIDVEAMSDGLAAVSPGGGFAPARSRNVTVTCYQDDDCSTGRIRSLVVVEELNGGVRTQRITELHFQYSSAPDEDVRGDLNETNRFSSHAYVYATITATTQLRGGAVSDAVLTGWRHWHSNPNVRYLFFDLTETLPQDERAPYASMRWSGGWDVAADDPGEFERVVTLRDGRSDTRTWTLDEDDSVDGVDLSIAYHRTAPDGMTAAATGIINLGGTRHCRLDDSGTMNLVRVFNADGTEPTRPISEVVDHSSADGRHNITGHLYLADGTVLERSATRTVVIPAECDNAHFPQVLESEGVSYHGVTYTSTMTKTGPGTLSLEATRTATDGTITEITVDRVNRNSTVVVAHYNATGALVAELVLEVDPTDLAVGTLTRYDESGQVIEVIEIERDLSGRFYAGRPGSPRNQFHRINRGEL